MIRAAPLLLALALGPLAACQLGDTPPQLPPTGKAMATQDDDRCLASGGVWSHEDGKARVCIHYTKDAGKICTRSSECDGACLARSGTCSPVKPLLGCQSILTDSGMRMTQCVN
ncbi:hypothetical protein [Acidimangrovimonas sediminis]|uniref:hypothetical protein n=1 Tax=Acidimangrovimonas sediminis TaxID=2056283 RepID=UPI000C7FBC7F|nr:hypothetical protein [Acidimangrovimonas sediminis]